MATLAEIHEIQIEMLSKLDEFCTDNNIKYTMIGGTMLGAIRHHGFIPWDDDIDIAMSMSDFNVLKRNFKNSKYTIQTSESDIEMPFVMYKMRLNNSIMPEQGMESLNMHQGIWIDIFVYTYAAKTVFVKNIQSWLFRLLKSYRCRYLNRKDRIIHKILCMIPPKIQLIFDLIINKMIIILGCRNSNEYFVLDEGKYRIYPRKYMDESKRYLFEGKEILGVKDSNDFLTWVYGSDYMTPRKWCHLPDCSMVIINSKE